MAYYKIFRHISTGYQPASIKPFGQDRNRVDLKQQSKLPVDFLLVYNKGELSKTSGRFSSGI